MVRLDPKLSAEKPKHLALAHRGPRPKAQRMQATSALEVHVVESNTQLCNSEQLKTFVRRFHLKKSRFPVSYHIEALTTLGLCSVGIASARLGSSCPSRVCGLNAPHSPPLPTA